MKKQIIVGVSIGIITTTLGAIAKSRVDVAKLKANVNNLFSITMDTNERIKRIETFLIQGKR